MVEGVEAVPLFIQVHSITGAAPVAWAAHRHDSADFGAICLRHWVSDPQDVAFCLAEADSADRAAALHADERSLCLERIHPVLERL
jgi:hypothetical protein